jgi:hypothetical protein
MQKFTTKIIQFDKKLVVPSADTSPGTCQLVGRKVVPAGCKNCDKFITPTVPVSTNNMLIVRILINISMVPIYMFF